MPQRPRCELKFCNFGPGLPEGLQGASLSLPPWTCVLQYCVLGKGMVYRLGACAAAAARLCPPMMMNWMMVVVLVRRRALLLDAYRVVVVVLMNHCRSHDCLCWSCCCCRLLHLRVVRLRGLNWDLDRQQETYLKLHSQQDGTMLLHQKLLAPPCAPCAPSYPCVTCQISHHDFDDRSRRVASDPRTRSGKQL
jgi:hypothetical protein